MCTVRLRTVLCAPLKYIALRDGDLQLQIPVIFWSAV